MVIEIAAGGMRHQRPGMDTVSYNGDPLWRHGRGQERSATVYQKYEGKQPVKTLQNILIACAAVAAAAFVLPMQAQSASPQAKSAAAKADQTEGEVRKIDKVNKRITLKHGEIKNLDMPPMTMVFQAADPAMLDKVKVGDKVRFVAANPGGKLTVTEIQPVK